MYFECIGVGLGIAMITALALPSATGAVRRGRVTNSVFGVPVEYPNKLPAKGQGWMINSIRRPNDRII